MLSAPATIPATSDPTFNPGFAPTFAATRTVADQTPPADVLRQPHRRDQPGVRHEIRVIRMSLCVLAAI